MNRIINWLWIRIWAWRRAQSEGKVRYCAYDDGHNDPQENHAAVIINPKYSNKHHTWLIKEVEVN